MTDQLAEAIEQVQFWTKQAEQYQQRLLDAEERIRIMQRRLDMQKAEYVTLSQQAAMERDQKDALIAALKAHVSAQEGK